MRGQKPGRSKEKRNSGQKPEKPAPPAEGRSGFTFVDRSGKIHGPKGRPEGSPGEFKERQRELPQKPKIELPHERPTGYSKERSKGAPKRFQKELKPEFEERDFSRRNGKKKKRFEQPKRFEPPKSRGPARSPNRPPHRFQNKNFKDRHHGDERPKPRQGSPRDGVMPTLLKAIVDKNRKGFAFLAFENRDYEDAFVPPHDAERLFHGDRVEVKLSSRGEALAIDVLEHRFRELVGRFTPHPMGASRGGWVVYERKRAREEIFIPEVKQRVKPNDWIRAKLEFHEKGQFPVTAEITEVYGATLPPSADLGMVAAEFNLIEEHSEQAEAEARSYKLEIPGKDMQGREDLRGVPFITIDGETARDFDDAVYVQRERSGHVLWVAIADVSHYVTKGSALDQDALSRGTSVYFPERAFHMLPRALSENLCSLRPDEPRLALVAKMHFDRAGKNHKTELMEAAIQSKRRATYNQIEAENRSYGKDQDWEFAPHFELYRALRKMRSDRGSIDFDLPESELVVKPTGEVVSIKERPRLDAHRLIEEFMIAANEAVTEWMLERKWPFVYRVHDDPALDALEKFHALAANMGFQFSLENARSPKAMADAVRKLEGHPAQTLLNMALLRSMKQAVYSSTHSGHYGLASQAYTHFTSPIRRYPDLVVHRLLRRALRTEKGIERPLGHPEREALERELAEICEHCSYRERLASDAERESIKLKQVRAMIDHLGDDFDGTINGMTENGLFVRIADPFCEGFVEKDSMHDDFYQFNEDRMIFYGKRKKRTFKVGDELRVQCVRADIDRRQIDFQLTEEN